MAKESLFTSNLKGGNEAAILLKAEKKAKANVEETIEKFEDNIRKLKKEIKDLEGEEINEVIDGCVFSKEFYEAKPEIAAAVLIGNIDRYNVNRQMIERKKVEIETYNNYITHLKAAAERLF